MYNINLCSASLIVDIVVDCVTSAGAKLAISGECGVVIRSITSVCLSVLFGRTVTLESLDMPVDTVTERV